MPDFLYLRAMKNIILAAALSLLLFGCQSNPYAGDPVAKALEAHLALNAPAGEPFELILTDLQCVDSTTFATEFDRRIDVFGRRIAANSELYERHTAQGRLNNASLKKQAVIRDRDNVRGLQAMRDSYQAEGRLDDVAWYAYRFSGRARSGKRASEFKDCWFNITSAHDVIVVSRDRKDLDRSGGRSIPGYIDLIGGNDAPEQ